MEPHATRWYTVIITRHDRGPIGRAVIPLPVPAMRTLITVIVLCTIAGAATLMVADNKDLRRAIKSTVASLLPGGGKSATSGSTPARETAKTPSPARTVTREPGRVLSSTAAEAPRTDSSLGTPDPLRDPAPTDRQVRTNTATGPVEIDPEPSYDRKEFEKMFFDEVNHQRLLAGRRKLKWRSDLSEVARKHSEDQAADSRALLDSGTTPTSAPIRHEGRTSGTTVLDRLTAEGIRDFSLAGENILSIALTDELVVDVAHPATVVRKTWRQPETVVTGGVRSWMLSPSHRENILMKDYNRGGVGVTRVGDFLIVTQVFARNSDCGFADAACCEDPKDGVENPDPWCYEGLTCTTREDEDGGEDRICTDN